MGILLSTEMAYLKAGLAINDLSGYSINRLESNCLVVNYQLVKIQFNGEVTYRYSIEVCLKPR